MPWGAALAATVTPLGTVSGDLVSYITGFGVLGAGTVLIGYALYKDWRFMSPAARDAERRQARGDLERENDDLRAQLERAEHQREQLTTVVAAFTTAVNALMPLLQKIIIQREDRNDPRQPRRDRR